MEEEVYRELGIVPGEENVAESFFAELNADVERYKRKHGEFDEVKEEKGEDDSD